jgi:uncharacterized protein YdiU (UPF0061 family)
MNTDNMSILGLTIDYGPFGFLDAFDPATSATTATSKAATPSQPPAQRGLLEPACAGPGLLPLIGEPFKADFPRELEGRMRAKLGLATVQGSDRELIESIQKLMAAGAVDHTIFWRRLSHAVAGGEYEPVRDLFPDRAALDAWLAGYTTRLTHEPAGQAAALMLRTNPKYVLRNHLGEQAIRQAKLGDFSGVSTLLALLQAPFDEHPGHDDYAGFPPDWASTIEISCSS